MIRASVQLRPNQRVRLAAHASPATFGNPWGHQWGDGTYRKWWVEAGEVRHRAWRSATASGSPEIDVQVTSTGGCADPRGAFDREGRLHLLYTYSAGGSSAIMETVSTDEGKTWSTPTVAFANGTHPTISVGLDGTVLRCAVVGGKIACLRTSPGTPLASAESFNLKDDSGNDLLVEDDTFHLVAGMRLDAPWMLHVRIDSAATTSDWVSGDDGRTWKQL